MKNDDSSVWFAYSHGMISESLWNSLLSNCCTSNSYTRENCLFSTNPQETCQNDYDDVMNVIYGSGLNWYNIIIIG